MMTFVRRDLAQFGATDGGTGREVASFLAAAAEAIAAPATEVVSFDVFDTLLKRRARSPVAFFEVIGAQMAREGWLLPQLSPGQFRAQRVAAERRARARRRDASGHGEVRLAEIWQELAGLLAPGAAGPEEAAEAEFAIERDHIFGNAPVLDLLAFAARRGRRIALVSDTYFSADQLVRLLRRATAGRDDLDPAAWRVFASAEHGTGKAGTLFDTMLRGMGGPAPSAVVHLGDIYAADIEPAARRGLRAVLLPNGTAESWEILGAEERYRAHAPSLASAGAAADPVASGELTSLRNAALLQGDKSGAFDHFAFGCAVLGPILDHYLRWVEGVLDRLGPGTLACGLLREGGFLAELLAERRPRQPVVALGISRLAMARAALAEVTADTLTAALPTRHAIPFSAFCARIGLTLADFPRGFWTQSLSTRDAPMVEEVVRLILADPALKARIAAGATSFRARMERHLASVLGAGAAGRGAVLLDVGWACSIQDRLIRGFGVPAERLTGLYLALNDRGLERITAGKGLLAAGCLFDGTEGHRLATPALRFIEILEQSATPAIGSVVDYDEAGAPIYGEDHIPPAQRAERAEVQRGIRAFLAHAARHRAEAGGAAEAATEAARRAQVQAIFLRASLAPTAAERALFTNWLHDDSFADGALDALVPEPHRRLAPYMTPAQLAGAGFLHTYWPFGTLDAESRLIAEQGAAARLLGDRFELFAQEMPLGLEVVLDGGPGWTLARFPQAGVNTLRRAALEFESNVPVTDRLLLQFRPEKPLRLVFDLACFARPGGAAGEERQELVLEATALAPLLRWPGGGTAAPPGAAWELPGEGTLTTIQLRLPERVMRWQGRLRTALGLRIEAGGLPQVPAAEPRPRAAEARAAGEPKPKGWFDTFLGARTPLADGPLPLDGAAEMLTCQGWLLDSADWTGPDAVELVLEPEGPGEILRFPGELYPRPDLTKGFKRAIRGLTGCRARLPIAAVPAGRYARIAWEGRFGDRTARIEAPYAATVGDGPRRGIALEVTGPTRYA